MNDSYIIVYLQIVPASLPEPVHNCTVWQNATAAGTIFVVCQPGWDGGLVQNFHLEIQRLPGGHSSKMFINDIEPVFVVNNLSPGTEYFLSIAAVNSQGTSAPISFSHFTPIDKAEETLSAVAKIDKEEIDNLTRNESTSPSLPIILGIVGGIALTLLLVGILVAVRMQTCSRENLQNENFQDDSLPHTDISETDVADNNQTIVAQDLCSQSSCSQKDPDVIYRGGEYIYVQAYLFKF